MYGLTPDTTRDIQSVFEDFTEVNEVWIYGSRAMGRERNGSDIDLTLFGKNLNLKSLLRIQDALDELCTPYEFDISLFRDIDNADLIQHINRVGRPFFKREAMREDWQTVKLGEVCALDKSRHTKGDMPYVGMEHIESHTGRFLGDLAPKSVGSATFQFTPKHLLYGRLRPYLNKVMLPDFAGHCSSEVFPIECSERILRSYLFYWITWQPIVNLINETCTGARMPRANVKEVLDFAVPLPPLPEQERIVAVLDKAFKGIDQAIAHTEQNLASARELFESYLNNIFTQRADGWEEKKLGDVCDFLNGFAFKSADTIADSNVQLIRMGNLYQNILDLNRKPAFYPNHFKDEYSRYLLSEGDFIISLTGTVDKEDYGYTVEIPECSHSLILNQRIAKFTNFSDDIFKRFLLYFLRSRVFLDGLYASARGVRQANLSTVTMKTLSVFFPDVDSQRELVNKFDSLRVQSKELEALYTEKLESLKELKQSLLQQAFAGELTKEVAA